MEGGFGLRHESARERLSILPCQANPRQKSRDSDDDLTVRRFSRRMILHPPDRVTLAASLRTANKSRERVKGVDLSTMNRILRHTPEDMTTKVEAGLTLGELQRALAE